jgi:hypothetical protein
MNVFDQVAVTTWDQKVHNSTHRGPRLLDGQESWSERSEATCEREDSENCTKMHQAKFKTPNGDLSWCIYSVSTVYTVHTQMIPSAPKHFEDTSRTSVRYRSKRSNSLNTNSRLWHPMATDDACTAQALRIFQHRRDAKSWSVRSRHETSTSRSVGCTRWILLWGCDSMCCLSW